MLCLHFCVLRPCRASPRDIPILVYGSHAPACALTPLSSSTNSVEDILNGEDADVPVDAWKSELHTRVEQIVDRKRSSTEGRADSLNAYAHILMARYAKEDIEDRVGELLPSILRSIRTEVTERETVTAIKGKPAPSSRMRHS